MPKKGFFIFMVGAYLIRSSIKDITEAIKWKAYYGSHGDKPLPPGYYAKKAECSKWSESVKASKLPKTEAAIEKAINSAFNDMEHEKEAVEGQEIVSESYTDDCDACRIDIPASETLNEDEGSDN